MKLLSLCGSPRKGRNTDQVLDRVGRAFVEAGGEVEKLYVADLDINPCTGCYGCMKDIDGICVQQDDMSGLYRKLIDADALAWGTPVYMWSPTAQMKLFLDRLFPFGDYQSTRWRCALDATPVGLIMTYADADPIHSGIYHTHAILDIVAKASGGTVIGAAHAATSDDQLVLSESAPLMKSAAKLGADLAEAAKLRS